jgi:hypothetical protein
MSRRYSIAYGGNEFRVGRDGYFYWPKPSPEERTAVLEC